MMTLEEAIAEVKRTVVMDEPWSAEAVVLQAVASGDLIPKADAKRAVALAYQRAADRIITYFREQHLPLKERSPGANFGMAGAILALAPAGITTPEKDTP